ncbi:MAG: 4Fe-4S binding protein [Methanomicrobiaceae archaeon]|nr:4Fe-4S binding protein [Methanomicrobiaceae archaeon]
MKLLVKIHKKRGQEPIIARTVLDTGVLINVERANIESMSGEVLIEVADPEAKRVCDRLKEFGAEVERLEDSVCRNEEECIDCGECVSVCPQNVFSFDEEWNITLKTEKCVLCGKCVEACPHNALSLHQ